MSNITQDRVEGVTITLTSTHELLGDTVGVASALRDTADAILCELSREPVDLLALRRATRKLKAGAEVLDEGVDYVLERVAS